MRLLLAGSLLVGVALFGAAPATADPGCDARYEACNSQVWCPSTRTYQLPLDYCPYQPGVVRAPSNGGLAR